MHNKLLWVEWNVSDAFAMFAEKWKMYSQCLFLRLIFSHLVSLSATAAMEGAHFLATGSLVSLSEQLCVDCVLKGADTCDIGMRVRSAFCLCAHHYSVMLSNITFAVSN